MQKIIVAFEKMCEKTGHFLAAFNGRIEPNTTVMSEEQLMLQSEYFRSIHNSIISPKSEYYGDDLLSNTYLFYYAAAALEHEFRLASELTNEIYIYPIEILLSHVYNLCTSHIAISDKVRTDIINNRAYLVFLYEHEGDFDAHHLLKFRELVKKLNLPKERIYLIHGNHDTAIWNEEPYMYHPVNIFPWWLVNFKRDTIIDFVPDKLYNCYNRRPRNHRCIVLALLYRNNLLNNGIVSFGIAPVLPKPFPMTDEEHKFLVNFMGTSPDDKKLNADSMQSDNPASDVVDDHYRRTFVSLVNETLTDSVFFSEKIYKPILVGHPFLLMGAQYQLRQLREFGFKTFSKWWDESYDDLKTEVDRATHIVKILSDLNTKTPQELIAMREEMKEILIHNQQVFNKIVTDTPYAADTPIKDFLVELVNKEFPRTDTSIVETNSRQDWRKRLAQFSGKTK